MKRLLKLTEDTEHRDSVTPIWVNVDHISAIQVSELGAWVVIGSNTFYVRESPDEIMDLADKAFGYG